jgi:hypothetical protein
MSTSASSNPIGMIAGGVAVFVGCSIVQAAGGSSMFESTFDDPDNAALAILMQVTWWPGWIVTVLLIGGGVLGLINRQSATTSADDSTAAPATTAPTTPTTPTATTAPTTSTPTIWAPDPFGRHAHRLFDGSAWTDSVADHGLVGTDPASYPAPDGGAGWAADPYGRYPSRYHDGRAWTDHVARAGQTSTDPVGHPPPTP